MLPGTRLLLLAYTFLLPSRYRGAGIAPILHALHTPDLIALVNAGIRLLGLYNSTTQQQRNSDAEYGWSGRLHISISICLKAVLSRFATVKQGTRELFQPDFCRAWICNKVFQPAAVTDTDGLW